MNSFGLMRELSRKFRKNRSPIVPQASFAAGACSGGVGCARAAADDSGEAIGASSSVGFVAPAGRRALDFAELLREALQLAEAEMLVGKTQQAALARFLSQRRDGHRNQAKSKPLPYEVHEELLHKRWSARRLRDVH